MSQQINLFNPIFLKRKKYFSAVTMVQALGLILAGAALIAGYGGYQSYKLRKEAFATSVQLSQVQTQLAQITTASAPRQKSKALEESIGKSEAEVKVLRQVFETLQKGELGNKKGYSDYMRAFSRQILPGLWLTGFNIAGAGNEIGIQGRTLQPELVPEYLNRLKRESSMQGKSFATLEMRRPMTERKDRADVASNVGTGQQAPVSHIEFALSSSGISEDASDTSGAKVR